MSDIQLFPEENAAVISFCDHQGKHTPLFVAVFWRIFICWSEFKVETLVWNVCEYQTHKIIAPGTCTLQEECSNYC